MKSVLVSFMTLFLSVLSYGQTKAIVCSHSAPGSSLTQIFIFSSGYQLQAICQRNANSPVTDNKEICANDFFLMTYTGKTSSYSQSNFESINQAGTSFEFKKTSKTASIKLNKNYKSPAFIGNRIIDISSGDYILNCK